jgi:hypothetical protein
MISRTIAALKKNKKLFVTEIIDKKGISYTPEVKANGQVMSSIQRIKEKIQRLEGRLVRYGEEIEEVRGEMPNGES